MGLLREGLPRTGPRQDVPGGRGQEEQYGLDSKGDWGLGTTEELQDFVENIKTGGQRKPNANVETGRVATMMCLMARKAHVNPEKNAFEPRVVEWKDLGSSTDA